MKLTISKDLKEILPSFLVSAYTFDLLEKNDKEHLSNEISEGLSKIAQEYQKNYSLDRVVNINHKIPLSFLMARFIDLVM